MIKLSELRKLPVPTLSQMALAIARDIDAGDTDKRDVLETILKAVSCQSNPRS